MEAVYCEKRPEAGSIRPIYDMPDDPITLYNLATDQSEGEK
jgi:hypothetical protein